MTDTPLPKARELMGKHRIRHLPVVDDKMLLLGIVTDRDLRSAYPSSVVPEKMSSECEEIVSNTTVSQVMTSDCVTITPKYTLDDTLLVFDRMRVGALPVIDSKGKILGMFSIRDMTAAYKKLFGMAEKGSVLIVIEDEGRVNCMSSIVLLLEEFGIPFTRLLRLPAEAEQKGRIYLRLNTFNMAKVNTILQNAGFRLLKPEMVKGEET